MKVPMKLKLRTLHLYLSGYDRVLNRYWELRRRAWYALDCPPTIVEGLFRKMFGR